MIIGAITLSLLAGPIIPQPVPRIVIEALSSVEVTHAAGDSSGFQLQFEFDSQSDLNTLFLIAPALSNSINTPALRIVLALTINGLIQPLFDGVMTKAQVTPTAQGGATISITGEDLTKVMDTQSHDGHPYPALPFAARVAIICAKYAHYGIIPLPIAELFPDVHLPIQHIPSQQGSDLAYINQLAEEAGYVFYIEPLSVGTNIAYFGPKIKTGVAQPALTLNMGALNNVETLDFSFDPTAGVLPVIYLQNQLTRSPLPIPVPNINPLQPPLGVIPTTIGNITKMRETAKMSPAKAMQLGLAQAAQSKDSVSATGKLNVQDYGHVLKARQLVGVRGAGLAYDGLYYVEQVTSKLEEGKFMQDFKLTRNGLISTVTRVAV